MCAPLLLATSGMSETSKVALNHPTWTVYAFLTSFGAIAAAVALLVAFKYRRVPLALPTSLGAGVSLSSIGAALGTQIKGLPGDFTWAYAATVAGCSFLASLPIWTVVGLVFMWWILIRPLQLRFGRVEGMRAWVALLTGNESFHEWVERGPKAEAVDAAWDEVASAGLELQKAIENVQVDTQNWVNLLAKGGVNLSTGEAMKLVRTALEDAVKIATGQLMHTSLNFTVWRVHERRDELEHLATFPVDAGDSAGRGLREPLRVWSNTAKTRTGCVAAEAMLQRAYLVWNDTQRRRGWPRRGLGKKYHEVAAMPVPCDSSESVAWAVVCIENREGLVPLESTTVRTLVAQVARVVDCVRSAAMKRDIEKTR